MQTVSPTFSQLAASAVRPINWALRISFDKTFDPAIGFFTLDVSLLDGTDILSPETDDVIADWDKYNYADFTDRVISIEVSRKEVEPYSVVQAIADVTVDNYDKYFTPNSSSPIESFILPRRPLKIFGGFGTEVIPLFVGLTESMPTIDKQAGTATFHCVDFLTYIFDRELGNTIMLEDTNTGAVLAYLFDYVGLLPGQYVLDPTSFNAINYFYVEKKTKLGTVVKDLMQAEQGRLFMDELGIIRFLNRQNYASASSITFTEVDVVDYNPSDDNDIINSVRIESSVLEEQPASSVWELATPQILQPGDSVDIFANFTDPVTDIDSPIYSETPAEYSLFTTTEDFDGTIPYAGIVLTSIDVFSKAVKMVFTNSGSTTAYITQINLWGTPVKVKEVIIVQDFDQTSIDEFEEQPYNFTTSYIQDRDTAVSKAAIMVEDYKDYGSIIDLEVIGTFALQNGDVITLDAVDGYNSDYTITEIVNTIANNRYRQKITGKKKDLTMYFTLDVSVLNGTDVLSP